MKLAEKILRMNEIATIGSEKGYKYTVHREPLKNPSFHLHYKNDFVLALQIKDLTILEVISVNKSKYEFKKGGELSGEIRKKVDKFLQEKNKKNTKLTNLEAIEFSFSTLNEE